MSQFFGDVHYGMSTEICSNPSKPGVAASAQEIQADQIGGLPVWVRAPKSGQREKYTSTSRSKLYEWAGDGLIESRSIRRPGQVRGVRLFSLRSIMKLIEGSDNNGQRAHAEAATYN